MKYEVSVKAKVSTVIRVIASSRDEAAERAKKIIENDFDDIELSEMQVSPVDEAELSASSPPPQTISDSSS